MWCFGLKHNKLILFSFATSFRLKVYACQTYTESHTFGEESSASHWLKGETLRRWIQTGWVTPMWSSDLGIKSTRARWPISFVFPSVLGRQWLIATLFETWKHWTLCNALQNCFWTSYVRKQDQQLYCISFCAMWPLVNCFSMSQFLHLSHRIIVESISWKNENRNGWSKPKSMPGA